MYERKLEVENISLYLSSAYTSREIIIYCCVTRAAGEAQPIPVVALVTAPTSVPLILSGGFSAIDRTEDTINIGTRIPRKEVTSSIS